MITFGLFLLLMMKGYRCTFFSTKTGKQQLMDRFKSEDDTVKASVLVKNKKMWLGIREEAKEWVLANWWKWREEKPEWRGSPRCRRNSCQVTKIKRSWRRSG